MGLTEGASGVVSTDQSGFENLDGWSRETRIDVALLDASSEAKSGFVYLEMRGPGDKELLM